MLHAMHEAPMEEAQDLQAPEQESVDAPNHPAVIELKRIQAEWKRTGIKDPKIDGYLFAFNKAMQAGLDEEMATIFAAKAATGF